MDLSVAVLGCGPAGLMAAHGAVEAYWPRSTGTLRLQIFSRKRKSPLYGAQYLHKPIPGMTTGDGEDIDYQLRGMPEEYRLKVYGRMYDGSVSPEDYLKPHKAWDIRETYDRLWTEYEPYVQDTWLDPMAVRKIIDGGWDIIINTVPRDMLCYRGHTFGATEVVAAGDAPDLNIDIGRQFRCDPFTVVCNGLENPSWYRMSNIFDHTTVEWPLRGATRAPVETASIVRKPVYHACDCWPGIHHSGRYGAWRKGTLSHESYFDGFRLVQERLSRATTEEAS